MIITVKESYQIKFRKEYDSLNYFFLKSKCKFNDENPMIHDAIYNNVINL